MYVNLYCPYGRRAKVALKLWWRLNYSDYGSSSGGTLEMCHSVDILCSELILAPNYSREEWFSVKETLGLPFPNVSHTETMHLKV